MLAGLRERYHEEAASSYRIEVMGGPALTLYDLIGVEPDASAADIAERIEALKQDWDPGRLERRGGAELRQEADLRYAELLHAEEILCSRSRRAEYDASLRKKARGRRRGVEPEEEQEVPPPPEPEPDAVAASKRRLYEELFGEQIAALNRSSNSQLPVPRARAPLIPEVFAPTELPPLPFPTLPVPRPRPSVVDRWIADVRDWSEDLVVAPVRTVLAPLLSEDARRLFVLGIVAWLAMLGCFVVAGLVREGSVVWNLAHVGMCIAAIGVLRSMVLIGYVATVVVMVLGVAILLWRYAPTLVESVLTNFW